MSIVPYSDPDPPHRRHRGIPINPDDPSQERPPKPNAISTPRKILFVFLKCAVMAFILSLFLIFLGFAAVILIHFLLTTTAFRRRRRRRERHPGRAAEASPPHSAPDLMDRLPCLSYSSSSGLMAKDCAICLDSFKEDERCRKLPACNHLFHMKCVDSWIGKVPNCPICRTRVELDSSGSNLSNEDWKTWWVVGV
ncbi:unnamed protein product [Cuscuta europaea]|uniref:RING-type domain-containing protein n=1 Tax=Cuscuta europaea TaxID=41803 RepID=A0A9P1E8K1_CUSEU|nr:unnamed protein product [Cuscuta europaea]